MGAKIGNRFYPGTKAEVIADFLQFCEANGHPIPHGAKLVRAYMAEQNVREDPHSKHHRPHTAIPIILDDEVWVPEDEARGRT